LEGGVNSIITNNGGNNVIINWLSGNINTNPMFVDTALHNFHLQDNSSCINAADTTGLPDIPLVDLDNNNRFVGVIDMGCYENQNVTGTNWNDHRESIIGAYPNPAKEDITIESPQPAAIEITNLHGQLIKTMAASDNKTTVDVSAFPCGMYFIKVKMSEGIVVKKFIKE